MAPRRVVHIVENLNRGAVENWLVRMLGHAHAYGMDVDWDFYCVNGQPGELDEKVRRFGSKVLYSPVSIGRKADFARALRMELSRNGYGILHCHHDLLSAVYLCAAVGIPFHRRIVHVHNADEVVPTPNVLRQRLYRGPMRRICLSLADRIVGISEHTLDTFLGGRSRRPGVDQVLYYGVDSTPFQRLAGDRARLRSQLDLPPDSLILLFGGRIVPEKNPVFVVDVLAHLRRVEPRAVAVFAGAGSLEPEVLARARGLGVERSVHLIGWRDDLPEVMSCSDCFILPRPENPMEGFGLAVVEAQLAGLRMLLSRGVPDDPLLPGSSFRRLSLAAGAEKWAAAALELLKETPMSREEAQTALKGSPMDMDKALTGLVEFYS
jgi:glycosyltransferase involved in cell wall biosynthesis